MNKKKKWGIFFIGLGSAKLLIKGIIIGKAFVTGGVIGAISSYLSFLGVFALILGMTLFMFGIREPSEKNIEKEFEKLTRKKKKN